MKAIYTKLLSIQSELGVIKKDETASVGKFSYRYFDINALIAFIKPYLIKNKLVLTQPLSFVGDKGAIRTILFDVESGESIEDVTPLTYNEDPQKMGSAITYYRRYAIQSLFLLEAEDDDGNAAKPEQQKPSFQKAQVAPASTQSSFSPFVLDGYEYVTGISQKTNKPWYAKQVVGTKDKEWLQAFDYDQAYSNYLASLQVEDVPF